MTSMGAESHGGGPSTVYGWQDPQATPSHSYIWPAVRRLLAELPKGSHVLDLGCGNGWTAARLAEQGFRVAGVDASSDGIALARGAHPGLEFHLGSVYETLPDLVGDFDAVSSTEVIEHLYSPTALFIRAGEYLKPGGCLIISTPYHGYLKNLAISLIGGWDAHHTTYWEGGHIKFFSRKSLRALAEGHGFKEDRFTGAGRLPYLWKSMAVRFRANGISVPSGCII